MLVIALCLWIFPTDKIKLVLLFVYVLHENYSDSLHVFYVLITIQTNIVAAPSEAFTVTVARMLGLWFQFRLEAGICL